MQQSDGSAPVRLAILVVYLFRPERRELFQLHLSKVRQNTGVPYRVFGSVWHLTPELAVEVAAEPDIEAVHLPTGQLANSRDEHADLLQRLFAEALKGDYTHFCTMHLDSFPVAPDWVPAIVGELEKGAAFATLAPHGYSACLFWPRSFHDEHRAAERESDAFERFRQAHPDYDMVETGLGFLHGAWQRGLRWHEMRAGRGQQVCGRRIFHLVAGTRYTVGEFIPVRFGRFVHALRPAFRPLKPLLPKTLWRGGRRMMADDNRRTRDGTAAEKKRQLDLLLSDPDEYLRRSGMDRTAAHPAA